MREFNFIFWVLNVEYVVNNEWGYVYSDFGSVLMSKVYDIFFFYLLVILVGFILNVFYIVFGVNVCEVDIVDFNIEYGNIDILVFLLYIFIFIILLGLEVRVVS